MVPTDILEIEEDQEIIWWNSVKDKIIVTSLTDNDIVSLVLNEEPHNIGNDDGDEPETPASAPTSKEVHNVLVVLHRNLELRRKNSEEFSCLYRIECGTCDCLQNKLYSKTLVK